MGARLALALGSLVIGVALDAIGRDVYATDGPAFYVTVVLCFVATLVYRPFVGRIRRPHFFAAINVATDLALVSAMVLFSGGKDSVFSFLYVVVGLYGAMLFPGRRAVLGALAGSLAYGIVLAVGPSGLAEGGARALPALISSWFVHSAAMLGVAALAGGLAHELVRTGIALEERSHDLAQLRTLHQRTVESLKSGLLTTDLEGRVTSFNREAQRITGRTRDEAIGQDLEGVLPGMAACRAGMGGRMRMAFTTPGGRLLHLGIGSYALRDADGEAEGEVVIFQDVTEVVAMEDELRRAERLAAVGELSASIAHEIRNPLAAISGSIEMMQTQKATEEGDPARLMGIVVREVDRLDRLIGDFLQFARPAAPQLEEVDVAMVIGEVLEMFEASRCDAVVPECEVAAGLRVEADPGQLRQVLWNLLQNATQAMPDGGVVRFEARLSQGEGAEDRSDGGKPLDSEEPARVEIAVMDQGTGIPADAVEHVFDPFFTTKTGGTGLGLAIVHRVIAEHRGVVRIERGDERFTTVVRVALPGRIVS